MTNKMDEQLDALLVKLLSDTGAKTKPADTKELMELAVIYRKKYTEAEEMKTYWVDHCTPYFRRIVDAEKDMQDARSKLYDLCNKMKIDYRKFMDEKICDESDDE